MELLENGGDVFVHPGFNVGNAIGDGGEDVAVSNRGDNSK